MNRILALLFLASCTIISCKKSDNTNRCAVVTDTAASAEVTTLKAYLDSNKIQATADSRGFFYNILAPGDTSIRPGACSNITVTYTGRLTTGIQFDAKNGIGILLSSVITGWKEGIPLIGKGGSIILYIPPSQGYGSVVQGTIPANSTLVFAIDLLDVD
ncbi:MAG: FKBP-type peptidyl-prolyl cis-trans isomerase [Chitinophagaceae bacterium]